MDDLLRETAERAARYLRDLDQRPVVPRPEDVAHLDALGGPLPEGPTDPRKVLALLDDVASPATVATAGRRYFGFVIGGALPAALAATWLAAAWDQNAFLTSMSPVAAATESIALRWLIELLGLPSEVGGAFVTGATMANFTALAAARRAVLARAGWDVDGDGLAGAPPLTVIAGEEAHPTVRKALGLLGLGRNRVTLVPVDG